jgi:phosphoribosyl 1,2-cyclic phosphodiesterase
VYCNRLTRDALPREAHARLDFRLFATGASFDAGDVQVDTFSVPHDANDPVGFLLRTRSGNIGFLTDLGQATKLVVERVRASHALVLEANHDLKLLQDDPRRPWSVKQRILSRHGHLSNDAAAVVAGEVVTAELRHIFLGHLSGDCNRPELAHDTVRQTLDRAGAAHVALTVASQHEPCATFTLDAEAPQPVAPPAVPFPLPPLARAEAPAAVLRA